MAEFEVHQVKKVLTEEEMAAMRERQDLGTYDLAVGLTDLRAYGLTTEGLVVRLKDLRASQLEYLRTCSRMTNSS